MGADKGHDANPPDDGWDDHWDLDDGSSEGYWLADDDALWADAALDGRVRQQLAALVPLRHEAFDRWGEIQPRMARARRRRHAAQAVASSLLVAAVALAGVQGAGRFLPEDTSVVQAADGGGVDTSDSPPPMVGIGAATSTVAADGGTTASSPGPSADAGGYESSDGQGRAPGHGSAPETPTGDETTLATADSSGSTAGSSSVPVNGGSAASSVSITPPASYTATSSAPATSSTTVRSTTSTTRSTTSTTRAATTTTTTVATVLTVRELATVDVTLRGNEIRLVSVHNNAGVTSQVHNSGPQKIEITFKKGSEEHDLVATVHNGNVVTSIVDSDDD